MMRPVYRHAELNRVLNPEHVCIVGASPKAGSFGERVLTNLAGFGGNIYLVNSKYETIGDRRCYPSMAALPENPDCVAVVAPRDAVEQIVREAAQLRVGGWRSRCTRRAWIHWECNLRTTAKSPAAS